MGRVTIQNNKKILLRDEPLPGTNHCLCSKPNDVCYKIKGEDGFDVHCKTADRIARKAVGRADEIINK